MSCYVYVLAEDAFANVVKVGVSSDPQQRARKLGTVWAGSKPLRVMHSVRCHDRATAFAVEKATLGRLRLSAVKVRKEMAWCQPAIAYGQLRLAWEEANHFEHEELQYELFAA